MHPGFSPKREEGREQKKTNNPIKKITNRQSILTDFPPKSMYTDGKPAYEHMLNIISYHYTPVRMVTMFKMTTSNADKNLEEQELSFVADENAKWLQLLWKTVCQFG
jgi:hypothetical protein